MSVSETEGWCKFFVFKKFSHFNDHYKRVKLNFIFIFFSIIREIWKILLVAVEWVAQHDENKNAMILLGNQY